MGSRTGQPFQPAGRLPVALRNELARRAEAALAALTLTGGSVVGFDSVAPSTSGIPVSPGAEPVAAAGSVIAPSAPPASTSGAPATIVLSLAGIAASEDATAGLRRAAELLAGGGTLVALEPHRPPGARGWLADRAAAIVRARYGVRADLPVPALVRDAGFVISSIERFTMPTRVLPLRPFVEIVARRMSSSDSQAGPEQASDRPEPGLR